MHTRTILAGVLAAGALAVAPGVALADKTDQTAAQINKAVAAENAAPAARNPDVSIPSTGTGVITLGGSGAGEIAVDLPAKGAADQAGKTTVFDGAAPGAQVGVQPTAHGVRVLVHIDSAEAPERYPFAMSGDIAHLKQEADGSVSGYDADGQLVTHIAPAWARDANGRDVPTLYEIEGTTLVQVVKHRGGDWAYGITADPDWWKVAKCVMAVTWVLGTSIFVVAKITKIRGAIRALGGIRQTAKLLVGATSRAEKMRALGRAGAGAASYFLGIDTIRTNC